VGRLRIGGTTTQSDGIHADFALEAKAYGLANGVGVSDLSRLISRLKHRQFGVLVTTSYLAQQAYIELREDRHPVVVMSGGDIVEVLRGQGIRSPAQVRQWLEQILA
jgi:ABC-type lipopolysaccharide export system ATPase subunit